jgi:hypothetical protein
VPGRLNPKAVKLMKEAELSKKGFSTLWSTDRSVRMGQAPAWVRGVAGRGGTMLRGLGEPAVQQCFSTCAFPIRENYLHAQMGGINVIKK